jgi:geranylgeranyl pyrophosphate synthase
LRKGELNPDEEENLITEIRNSEAIRLSISEARVQIENAKNILDIMPDTRERLALLEVADYIVDRTI